MERAEVEDLADAYDAAVERDGALDDFCARSAWLLAYHDAFAPERPLWLARRDANWLLFAEHAHPELGSYLEPLENMWGFGSPLVGAGAPQLLAEALIARPSAVALLGLPLDSRRLRPMASLLEGRYVARSLQPTTRFVASLAGGLDGWLGRRRGSFRRNLRADARRCSAAGIEFRRVESVSPHDVDALYQSVLDVEERCWKSAAGSGVDQDPMRSFYSHLWRRLAPRNQLRLLFAERDGVTLGYLHGGLVGAHFRGLQFSFDETMRDLGLGNSLQLEMLCWLCEVGAMTYDLGAQSVNSEYKRRWAEEGLETYGLFLQPLG